MVEVSERTVVLHTHKRRFARLYFCHERINYDARHVHIWWHYFNHICLVRFIADLDDNLTLFAFWETRELNLRFV